MVKTITVTGATGAQGGAVARIMLEAGWKVRAVTQDTNSAAAEGLRSQGMDLVQASFDDEASLVKAFEGSQAIFAVTQFWAHVAPDRSQAEAGEREAQQGFTLAHAAARTTTLEHYIFSTHPSAFRASGGKWKVPHLDYKASVDDRIRAGLPELAAKTTFLFVGWYPKNMIFSPSMIPFEVPGSGGVHLWVQPSRADALMYNVGDLHVTPGICVKAILALPDKTQGGRYCAVAPELLSWAECLRIWSEVSRKKATYVACSLEEYEELWGVRGREIGLQWKWGEAVEEAQWQDLGTLAAGHFVGMEELGIQAKGVGMKSALQRLKASGSPMEAA